MTSAIYVTVVVVATAGLVYELVAAAAASYLLGDSITQFSTVIGAYLFAMGVGSFLSRWVQRGLAARFVQIEMLVGLTGGWAATLLFVAFGQTAHFRVVLYGVVGLVGMLVGLEIPLLLRLLRGRLVFRELVAQVLSLDYVGALAASILFPLLLVPKLGLIRTSLLVGLANAAVGLWSTWIFRRDLSAVGPLRALGVIVLLALGAGVVTADRITAWSEDRLYSDDIILAQTTPYQRIVLTRWNDDLRLFLNGHLQFSSRDEYRYHEALVHPALAAHPAPRRVLVLGGGDGMAVREILRYPAVQSVTLVDLDREVTRLFTDNPLLVHLNAGALRDPRVRIVNADAFIWLTDTRDTFDVVVADFPDPHNFSLGKLYSRSFYRTLRGRLAPGGVAVVQATSPMFARRSFWCITETMRSAGLAPRPYHVYVPSFGEWGFVLAGVDGWTPPQAYPAGLRFLTVEATPALFAFPPDMAAVPVEVNRLDNQILVHYYGADS
ncbi:MAG: polyamine aminopropyltransferase [Candidatus Rokuibacteriota bacterium]|nr:polyamine aminopropyltransferase [Patescibacteria group bacterium]